MATIIIVIVSAIAFTVFSVTAFIYAEEVHYNNLVRNKPVKITDKFIKENENKTIYLFEVTRHEIMSDETYRNPRVYYKNKLDKYVIRVNEEIYKQFDEGTYVTIKAKRSGSYVEKYNKEEME